jgi:hypothetical protein
MSFSRLLAAGKSMVGMQNAQSPYRMRAENLLPKFESTKKNPFTLAPKTDTPKPEPAMTPSLATPNVSADTLTPSRDLQLNLVSTVAVIAAKQSEPECVPVVVTPPLIAAMPIPKEEVQTVLQQRRVMQPEPNKGLVDASPLGLKTGTPTRAPLPAPVVAPPKAAAKQPKSAPAPSSENDSSQVAASKPAKTEQSFGWLAPLTNLFRIRKRPQPANLRKAVQTELSLDRVKVMRNDLNDADLEVVTIRRSEKAVAQPAGAEASTVNDVGSFSRMASRIFGTSQPLVR